MSEGKKQREAVIYIQTDKHGELFFYRCYTREEAVRQVLAEDEDLGLLKGGLVVRAFIDDEGAARLVVEDFDNRPPTSEEE